jgi:putative oxidoreductase
LQLPVKGLINQKSFFTGLWIICNCSFVIFTGIKFLNSSMKKLLSTHYSAAAFNLAILLLRIATGAIMMKHGYDKLVHFAEYKGKFMNFMGLGQATSLSLVIFAEFFCALFIIIGLFTRLAVIPLVIVMGVALFKAHNSDFMGEGETASLYFAAYVALLLVGPGRISVDGMVGK